MLKKSTIAVVVPAYNEESQIELVINTMPDFVDRIIVVDDASKDKTKKIVKRCIDNQTTSPVKLPYLWNQSESDNPYDRAQNFVVRKNKEELEWFTPHSAYPENQDDSRIVLLSLEKNAGVGGAIAVGYKWCKDRGIDCTAVMAGDGQMDPRELEGLCRPVIEDGIDYVKGNRLIHQSAFEAIPTLRFVGNSILSILTKLASGYWQISDTQTGYTAISKNALNSIALYKIYKRYGMPNDLLVKLNISYCTIKEIQIKPVYDVGEKSKMKVFRVILPILWLLIRSFFIRIWKKYFLKDFHPLFILYHMGILLLIFNIPFALHILEKMFIVGEKMDNSFLLIFIFLFISGFQSLLFAMWMDIQNNERLYE